MEHPLQQDTIVYAIFLVFTGAAVLATLALYARQSLLVAYILLGVAFGPWGLGLVTDSVLLKEIAHIGIMFLLFLMGLDLNPKELLSMVRKTTMVTALSSLIFSVTSAYHCLGIWIHLFRMPAGGWRGNLFKHHHWSQAIAHNGTAPSAHR